MEHKPKHTLAIAVAGGLALLVAGFLVFKKDAPAETGSPAAGAASAIPSATASSANNSSPAAGRPALTVTLAPTQSSPWNSTLAANGSVAAWQESIIGTELNGIRL
ncbi:MAG TPA: hypothetical protein VK751_24670, partial [Undibacterium sp.]|nr:hypothetical protein [Undibacterium sp.]